ncbi:TetR/AcrR family transcriptional regulator [Desnuesiella massiliensis]|uniref:TetR/AcrR family transcriptional regulator n=1 Tax=Desnuesiella massiliensis TaxID=1650662 RepID=UPI0006E19592|nr:TetR/AcrR family transcriptional regulator [Desnuesiella massiliensis]
MNKTKKAIFQAAIKVFSMAGYNGATMDDIALNAGVAKGTLYYHFKSKEEIFNYIITEGMTVMTEEVDSAASKEQDVLMKLKTMCRVQLKLVYENKDFFKVIMSQLWGQELRQLELRKVIGNYICAIEKYLKEAMEHGIVRKGDTSFMAYTLFGTLCSAAVYELINSENTDVDQLIDNLMSYVLNGISEK